MSCHDLSNCLNVADEDLYLVQRDTNEKEPPSVAISKKRRSLYILCCISSWWHPRSAKFSTVGPACNGKTGHVIGAILAWRNEAPRWVCAKWWLTLGSNERDSNSKNSKLKTAGTAHFSWDLLSQGAVRNSKPPPVPNRWLKSRRQLQIT